MSVHDLNGELKITLAGHTQGISDVSWTQDSSHLATASDDKLIKVWDIETVSSDNCYCVEVRNTHTANRQ